MMIILRWPEIFFTFKHFYVHTINFVPLKNNNNNVYRLFKLPLTCTRLNHFRQNYRRTFTSFYFSSLFRLCTDRPRSSMRLMTSRTAARLHLFNISAPATHVKKQKMRMKWGTGPAALMEPSWIVPGSGATVIRLGGSAERFVRRVPWVFPRLISAATECMFVQITS